MGYTHYWKIHKEIPLQSFKEIQSAAIAFAESSDTHLAISLNTHPLHLSLSLNGVVGHETFYLTPKETNFDFCKTAMKPYDEVVVATLNYAGKFEFFEWWSDGDKQDHHKAINLHGREAIYTCVGREGGFEQGYRGVSK